MMPVKSVLAAAMAAVSLLLLAVPPGSAQSSEELKALRKDLEAIKQGQDQLQKDVQEIKSILRAPRAAGPPPPTVAPANMVLTLDGDPTKGDKAARIVIVEFTDYQCPFCGRHVRDTFPQIESEYVKTGKVRYVSREFPLESIHPQAFKASEAALCAGDQGKYWEYHDRLFANQQSLMPDDLKKHATDLGLDAKAFASCLDSSKYGERVRDGVAVGSRLGVNSTPTVYVNGRLLSGAQPYETFAMVIDEELSKKR